MSIFCYTLEHWIYKRVLKTGLQKPFSKTWRHIYIKYPKFLYHNTTFLKNNLNRQIKRQIFTFKRLFHKKLVLETYYWNIFTIISCHFIQTFFENRFEKRGLCSKISQVSLISIMDNPKLHFFFIFYSTLAKVNKNFRFLKREV